jgi:hypothetical protein
VQAATRLEGMFDFIQVFALDRATLDRDIGGAHAALEPGGLLQVSYPKGCPTAQAAGYPDNQAATNQRSWSQLWEALARCRMVWV